MFGFAKDLLPKLPGWFLSSLPWLAALIGGLSLALSFFHFSDPAQVTWHNFTLALGSACVAGGVFGGITKSDQFLGIFRKTLEDIVWSDRFLETRADLDKVWVMVSHALSGKKFPAIKEKLNKGLLRHYFPNERAFYYTRNRRIFEIDGLSECGCKLLVKQTAEMDLAPHPGAPHVDYRNRYRSSEGGGQKQLAFEVYEHKGELCQLVDEQILKKYEIEDPKPEENSTFYGLNLPNAKYTIKRQAMHTVVLDKKPYIKFRFNTYSDGTEITVTGLTDQIRCNFESLGTAEEFSDFLSGSTKDMSAIRKEYTGLILPKQGFTLYFMVGRTPSRTGEFRVNDQVCFLRSVFSLR